MGGNQDILDMLFEMSIRNPSGDVKNAVEYLTLGFRGTFRQE